MLSRGQQQLTAVVETEDSMKFRYSDAMVISRGEVELGGGLSAGSHYQFTHLGDWSMTDGRSFFFFFMFAFSGWSGATKLSC